MTPRARRWLAAAITVVVLLYSGRWLADFAANRWWADAISPAAHAAVTRWQLLGLALDAGAVCLASAWFAMQGLLVARTIGTVQVQRRVGDELVRTIRQIYQINKRFGEIDEEKAKAEASELYELRMKAKAEMAEGRDLLKQMGASTRSHILKASRRLENLRSVNAAQEEYVQETYGVDIEEFR